MRNLVFVFSLAVAATITRPADMGAQIPSRYQPPRGLCRIWVPGRAPGRQPGVMNCTVAQRLRSRYGPRAFVVYGNRAVSRPGNARRITRTFNRTINGRRCRVVETWQYGRRIDVDTFCERRPYQFQPGRPNHPNWRDYPSQRERFLRPNHLWSIS